MTITIYPIICAILSMFIPRKPTFYTSQLLHRSSCGRFFSLSFCIVCNRPSSRLWRMKCYKRLRLSVPYSSHPFCFSYFFISFFYISPVTTFYTLYSPRSVIPLKEPESNVYMFSALIACASITISHVSLPKFVNNFCNLFNNILYYLHCMFIFFFGIFLTLFIRFI